jgi:imidazolonepropionase-like amidohydrolase
VVRIDDGRIVWVGAAADLAADAPSGEWHRFPDSTVLPGLVDAHTHFSLAGDGRTYEGMAEDSDVLMGIVGARNALVHLRAGVTTARDNGARNKVVFDLRDAIRRGWADGPTLLVAGRPITSTRGHFDWCNGVADGIEEIRATVRRLVAEGADHIKIMASGGGTIGTDPGRASYALEELGAAIGTAHGLGKLTTSHCRALAAMDLAIEAGTDCMEHGEFLEPDGVMRFNLDTALRMRDAGTYLSPTLQSSGWDTILRLRRAREERALTLAEQQALGVAELETEVRLDQLSRLLDIGMEGRLVGSTDAGCFDFSFGHMDYSMELMVAGGMTPMAAIQASTRVSAAACGVLDRVGTLEAGKRADLVIVAGDPSIDIRAMADVEAVYKGGRSIEGAGVPLDPRTAGRG